MKVPTAANCAAAPSGIVEAAGFTVRETKAAAVTVRVVEPEMPAAVPAIVAWPGAFPVTNPVPLLAATTVVDDVHTTEVDKSRVLPSE